MPKFNSAYFQTQILKNQIAVDVAVADITRNNNPEVAATIPTTDVSENSIFITANVMLTTTWPTSPASGDYLVDASGGSFGGTKVLRKYNGSNWSANTGLTSLQGVVFSSSSNTLVAGTAYNTNGSAVLTILSAASILDCSGVGGPKIFNVAASGVATPTTSGRYFNRVANQNILYNVANGVTDGTYTKITPVDGQSQLSSSGYRYYSSSASKWLTANAAHTHGEITGSGTTPTYT
jgi:hypothetical protein